jgi:hypothetical protein
VPRFRSILFVALLCSPVVAPAQDAPARDTLPFRRGQWAAQFAGGFGFGSLGVLRFTAPSRAWVLDFRLSGGHTHSEDRITNPDTTIRGYQSDASVSLRLGRRFYAPARGHVVGLYTIGASGGFSHRASGQRRGFETETNGFDVGAFFELGGSYLVTRQLSLGAIGSASLSYSRFISKGNTGDRSVNSRYGGGLGAVSLVATVHF